MKKDQSPVLYPYKIPLIAMTSTNNPSSTIGTLMLKAIHATVKRIQQDKPLILCLTNYVTMDLMANSLLALGAAPIMSNCDDELEELIHISHALMINIGTLDHSFLKRCEKAVMIAKNCQKPIILDPVGAGASQIRTQAAHQLMQHATILRGNASEIIALMDNKHLTKGVESIAPTEQAKATAQQLALTLRCTVVVSGEIDFVTNGSENTDVYGGSALMPYVTGMGCTLSAVIAAFQAMIPDAFIAAQQAATYFKNCGAVAHQQTNYPGTFRTTFIDALYANSMRDNHA